MAKKLVDPDRLCKGCMTELDRPMDTCPKCGFVHSQYRKPNKGLPLCEIINGKYLVGKVIGIGGFGITYIGWDFYQSKRVCIKEYFPREIAVRDTTIGTYPDQLSVSLQYTNASYTMDATRLLSIYSKGMQAYIKEAETLSKFYLMPGIVSVRDFFYEHKTAYIVMEYIDGIDMKRYAKAKGGKLDSAEVFPILKDVLKALNEVHKYNIIHRDISPDNIMITRDLKAKLIDFGASRDYVDSSKAPVLLKQGYAPLEQYDKEGNQGPWSDVYSMCASIYFLLTGYKIPSAQEREKADTVPLLSSLGVTISPRQDAAISKDRKSVV